MSFQISKEAAKEGMKTLNIFLPQGSEESQPDILELTEELGSPTVEQSLNNQVHPLIARLYHLYAMNAELVPSSEHSTTPELP